MYMHTYRHAFSIFFINVKKYCKKLSIHQIQRFSINMMNHSKLDK